MQVATPDKLVQTNARSLPIYKCMVNNDWEETQLARVWVMRKHENDNLTVGAYSVDLLCLGIKDTGFLFNTPQADCMQQFGTAWKDCSTVDYDLAHNIIFAGYDFALGFDIAPHIDFETTRFILEEDDASIPLIDVPVGANGIPHLIVNKNGQHADVLARLLQHAGEGNYLYSVAGEVTHPGEGLEEEGSRRIADFAEGDINLGNVYSIQAEEMLDRSKWQQRSLQEQVVLHAELLTRLLPPGIKGLPEDVELWDEMWEEMAQSIPDPNNVPADHFVDYVQLAELVGDLTALVDRNNEEMMEKFEHSMLEQIHYYAQHPLAIQVLYEHGVLLGLDRITNTAEAYAIKMQAQYPVLQCSLALGALIQNKADKQFNKLYTQRYLRDAIAGYDKFHSLELINFWLIKLWRCLKNNNIREAVQYYYMLADAGATTWLLLPVLEKYVEVLYNYKVSLTETAQA